MANEKKYTVRDSKTFIKGLTLYEAQKVLTEIVKNNRLEVSTRICRNDRFVAFYCEWDHKIKTTNKANEQEKITIDLDASFIS